MNQKNSLQSLLQIWKEVYLDRTKTHGEEAGHLSVEELYRMAEPGGIERSEVEAVDHLSVCPVCLGEWASWRRALTAVDELESAEGMEEEEFPVMAYGMREAAATAKPEEPVNVRSSCGRFNLGVLPRLDNPQKGMVTLEAVADGEMSVEDRHFTVRDRNGLVLLEGRLHQGRLARTCEKLADIDLTTWTLVVDEELK